MASNVFFLSPTDHPKVLANRQSRDLAERGIDKWNAQDPHPPAVRVFPQRCHRRIQVF